MIELFILVRLSRRISHLARSGGRSATTWVLILLGAWFAGEFVGFGCGAAIGGLLGRVDIEIGIFPGKGDACSLSGPVMEDTRCPNATLSPTPSGLRSRTSSRGSPAIRDERPQTIGSLWTRFCLSPRPELRGETCPSSSGSGTAPGGDTTAGASAVSGRSWQSSLANRTCLNCNSIPRRSKCMWPVSAAAVWREKKRRGRHASWPWSIAWRPEYQAPCGRGRSRASGLSATERRARRGWSARSQVARRVLCGADRPRSGRYGLRWR